MTCGIEAQQYFIIRLMSMLEKSPDRKSIMSTRKCTEEFLTIC